MSKLPICPGCNCEHDSARCIRDITHQSCDCCTDLGVE